MPRRLLAAIRKKRALELALAGLTQQQIAETLSSEKDPLTQVPYGRVSQQAVSNMLREARKELDEQVELTAKAYREHVAQQLNQALMVAKQSLKSNDAGERMAAIDRVVRITQALANLYGLEEPKRMDVSSSGEVKVVVEYVDRASTETPPGAAENSA